MCVCVCTQTHRQTTFYVAFFVKLFVQQLLNNVYYFIVTLSLIPRTMKVVYI